MCRRAEERHRHGDNGRQCQCHGHKAGKHQPQRSRNGHAALGRRHRAQRHLGAEGRFARSPQLLHTRLRFTHDLVGLCARPRGPHRPAGHRHEHRQRPRHEQGGLRPGTGRHRAHRDTARASVDALRPQYDGRRSECLHTLAIHVRRHTHRCGVRVRQHCQGTHIGLQQTVRTFRHERLGLLLAIRRVLPQPLRQLRMRLGAHGRRAVQAAVVQHPRKYDTTTLAATAVRPSATG